MPTDANIKVTGPRQVTWIPNAAPPPAPKVLYVVPTFAWRREVDEHGILSSWRRGGGLRVYLDRGWNASGYGEMLGVVLPPKGFADDPDAAPAGAPYKKYVTLWGNDPIWDSAFVPGVAPTLAHFPLARTAPDPTGAWLPPNAPADEKDQRPGPFAVSSLPTSGLQVRGGARRRRAARRVLRRNAAALVLRHRNRNGRCVLSLHSSCAGALSADLEPQRAPFERRAERHHRGCTGPLAQRHAGIRRPLRARRAVRCRLRRVERASRGLESALQRADRPGDRSHRDGGAGFGCGADGRRGVARALRSSLGRGLRLAAGGQRAGYAAIAAAATQSLRRGDAAVAVRQRRCGGRSRQGDDARLGSDAHSRKAHITDRLVAVATRSGKAMSHCPTTARAIDSSSPSTRNTWSTTPDPTTRRRRRKGDESSSSSTSSLGEARALCALCEDLAIGNWIFRGVANGDHPLILAIGRPVRNWPTRKFVDGPTRR